MAEPVTVAILAKEPVPGYAKTRLIPTIGADKAAALQADFIRQAVRVAAGTGLGPVALWAAPDASHPLFGRLAEGHDLALQTQPEGDLGVRILAAFTAAAGPAIVIGTDCPALTPAHLVAAADALRRNEVCLIPAEDGGYVLIGLRRPQPALFSDMPWSTPRVAALTQERAAGAGLSVATFPPLWDVDEPADLVRLAAWQAEQTG